MNKLKKQFPKEPQVGDILICKTFYTLAKWEQKLHEMGFLFSDENLLPFFRITITGRWYRTNDKEAADDKNKQD